MSSGLRTGGDAGTPFPLRGHAEVATILGRAGLTEADHVVVYDQKGTVALALLALLDWAGAAKLSYLDGGIEGWRAAGFHASTAPSSRPSSTFGGRAHPEFIVSSDELARLLGKPDVVVLDARAVHRILGETRAGKAARPGTIPGSVKLPLGALLLDNGALRSPAELLWVLRTRGITPDRAIVTTCDTGIAASDAWFLLRWLGFRDVRVHEEAGVVWSRTR